MPRKNPLDRFNTAPILIGSGLATGVAITALIASHFGGGGPNAFERGVETQAALVASGQGTPSLAGLNPIVIRRGASKATIETAIVQGVAESQDSDQESMARIACLGAAVTGVGGNIVFTANTRAELASADNTANTSEVSDINADTAFAACVGILVAGAVHHAEAVPGGVPAIDMAPPLTPTSVLPSHA